MKTCLTFLITLLFLIGKNPVIAQNVDSLAIENEPSSITIFEIANIKITGATHSSEKNIIARSGLRVGDKIDFGGYQIPDAVRALLKLRIYDDVQIFKTRSVGDLIFLEIQVKELPLLDQFSFAGIKKSETEELKSLVEKHLLEGTIVTEANRMNGKKVIKDFFIKKGNLDVDVLLKETTCPLEENCVRLVFEISKKEKVKIAHLIFRGNKKVSDQKLQKIFQTKTKDNLLAKPFFEENNFKNDLRNLVAYYNTLGYRDAKIVEVKKRRAKNGDLNIQVELEEGEPYFFGDITWEGNSKYEDALLSKILGIEKGDIFNPQLLNERLHYSPEGRDVSRLYMDDGHLFFQVEATEISLEENFVDLKIRIFEGAQTTIGKITITGNETTNEDVIRRELRTLPGDKFNREEIIRSQRAITNLGYFEPEKVAVTPKPNSQTGTVDLEYSVEENPNDKIELSGGWGGGSVGIVGTAGVQLNNFSLKKMFQQEGWSPIPRGDGQQLSLRTEIGGKDYQSYNFSFTEPWLNGKPTSVSFGTFYNNYQSQGVNENGEYEKLNIFGANASIGKRFRIGREYIVTRTGLHFNRYHLNDWSTGLFSTDDGETVSNGKYYNIHLSQSFTRTTLNHPIFPTSGSRVTLSMQFTPPYSLFSEKNNEEEAGVEERYKLLEYHKWRLDAEAYKKLGNKLTLKLSAKMGFMGAYNNSLGVSPFERFQLGGDALSNSRTGFTGTDLITLRGYDVGDLEANVQNGTTVATPLFNKFTAELRYPISTNPNAMIYGLAFAEAGNSWTGFKDYQPFQLKRSVGLGFRAHLPMFGTLGIDYGIGLDKIGPRTLKKLGQFSFILGFELD